MKVLVRTENLITASVAAAESQPLARSCALRVMHVINRLDTGGTEYGILKVIAGLDKATFEHRLCTTRGFDPGLVKAHRLDGKLFIAGQSGAERQFLLFRLARIMRAYRPHIVHSRNWGTIEAIPAARLARVPVAIHSEHGYEVETLAGLPRRQRLLRRVAYAMADAVFAVTGDLRSYHARQAWVSPEQIRVIPNGVDTRRFAPRPDQRRDARDCLGLLADSFVIGTVGRMVPIKDHPTLLLAAELLVGRGVDVRVVLAGSGPELARNQQRVESSAALSGRVRFLGGSDKIPDVLNALDVFVLPSLCEGMSNTLLEAMSSGLPVVATRVGGNPELVEDDGSGWLFSAGDPMDLAVRLERLAHDTELRKRFGAAARQRAVAQFSLDRMVADYRKLYLELAGRRGIPTGRPV